MKESKELENTMLQVGVILAYDENGINCFYDLVRNKELARKLNKENVKDYNETHFEISYILSKNRGNKNLINA